MSSTAKSNVSWRKFPPEAKRRLHRNLWRNRYWLDPPAFFHDLIDWPEGEGPTVYQDEVAYELIEHKREAGRGPHGLGKTSLAAWIVWWFATTRDGDDWKAPITASVWRQLSEYLWPEIHKWGRRIRWDRMGIEPPRIGHELLNLSLDLNTGSAFAVASNEPAHIEGAHADHILYIFDEAKTIPADTFDAAEGAFSGAGADQPDREAYALAFSTPGEPQGRFYEICSRRPGTEDWHVRHVTLDEAIAAGRISRSWADARRVQWGVGSAVYQNRVEGNFASTEEDTVIPLSWVEAANERWRFWQRNIAHDPESRPSFDAVGVDVADSGADDTVLALRYGDLILELRRYPTADTMETTGYVSAVLRANPGGAAVVDVIGIGAGVVARLRELAADLPREQRFKVHPFNAAVSSERVDLSGELEFANLRAEAWWGMRERLDPANDPTIALPPDDYLTGDLTAPKWKITSAGKIQIESKDTIRERIGRSTDAGDAVVMAYWQPLGKRKVRVIL